jgi:hypothetical protein
MPTPAYERYRQLQEEQLRADVELLYEGYCAKLRAFEAVERARGEGGALVSPLAELPAGSPAAAPPPLLAPPSIPAISAISAISAIPPALAPAPPPASLPAPRGRSGAHELYSAILDSLEQLPEVFDKNDVSRLLGYVPRRTNLHRVYRDLVKEGWLVIEDPRGGRWPVRYRRLESPVSTRS